MIRTADSTWKHSQTPLSLNNKGDARISTWNTLCREPGHIWSEAMLLTYSASVVSNGSSLHMFEVDNAVVTNCPYHPPRPFPFLTKNDETSL